jgi:hypothetical protein
VLLFVLWIGGVFAEEAGPVASAPVQVPFGYPTLLPVDEAAENPEFIRFRESLRQAVARRDYAFVEKTLDRKIKWTVMGDVGLKTFKERYNLRDPHDPFWRKLENALKHGGIWSSRTEKTKFNFPYVPERFPYEEYFAADYAVVTSGNAPVFEALSEEARVIGSFSWCLVPYIREKKQLVGKERRYWLLTRLPDGRQGYVREGDWYDPTGYQGIIQKKGRHWKITFFVGGTL